ncbi:RimJ/RimL family protein N-acetyltransferase [Massilia sp. UYP11]|uniref:GNAT family N-acetyltransferase n=1 Tax=Massilia sp. UYP11 TaxID=1756385 RepID=UPI003D1CAF2F
MTVLHSARLRFEPMSDAHYEGLRLLNGDPQVMRFITGRAETPEETRAVIARVRARWETIGYSWWSFIEQDTGELVGAGCIQHLAQDPANPQEIGWRLRPDRWGRGYAIEAAERMARFAFDKLRAPLLCAICDPANLRSQRIMEKLGMAYRGEEIWHGRQTLAYEIGRDAWQARGQA